MMCVYVLVAFIKFKYIFWFEFSHSLSTQDWLDIDFGIVEGVDFIAVSFVKSAEVINHLKSYIKARSRDRWVLMHMLSALIHLFLFYFSIRDIFSDYGSFYHFLLI